jgi:DUF971 family protein
MDPETPVAIRLDVKANLLVIDWADGHESRYDGGYLRWICPCAGCTGHVPGEVPPIPWESVRSVRVTHVEAVGTYALRLTLSDGHATGIYSFSDLRRRCPSTMPGLDDRGRPLAV